MKSLRVGDRVPDLALSAHDGRVISLNQGSDSQTIVLFFYPADNTPICTAEACAFRDAYQEFVVAGAAVIGISGDSQTTHGDLPERRICPIRSCLIPTENCVELSACRRGSVFYRAESPMSSIVRVLCVMSSSLSSSAGGICRRRCAVRNLVQQEHGNT